MKIEKTEYSYQATECDLKFGEQITLDGELLVPASEIDKKYRRKWFAEVRDEIEKLARFHSTDVPMVYGDGEETVDKMVSLEELGLILSEIEDGINDSLSDKLASEETSNNLTWI